MYSIFAGIAAAIIASVIAIVAKRSKKNWFALGVQIFLNFVVSVGLMSLGAMYGRDLRCSAIVVEDNRFLLTEIGDDSYIGQESFDGIRSEHRYLCVSKANNESRIIRLYNVNRIDSVMPYLRIQKVWYGSPPFWSWSLMSPGYEIKYECFIPKDSKIREIPLFRVWTIVP